MKVSLFKGTPRLKDARNGLAHLLTTEMACHSKVEETQEGTFEQGETTFVHEDYAQQRRLRYEAKNASMDHGPIGHTSDVRQDEDGDEDGYVIRPEDIGRNIGEDDGHRDDWVPKYGICTRRSRLTFLAGTQVSCAYNSCGPFGTDQIHV